MSYIRQITDPQERILMLTRPHWIYVIEGLFWFGAFVALGFFLDYVQYHYIAERGIGYDINLILFHLNQNSVILPWVFGAIGFLIFWQMVVFYFSTEIAVTSQRVIHKQGLMFIEVNQSDLEDIRSEQVLHGWLGWLFGYGRVHLDCRFVGDIWLPAFPRPYRLLKVSHLARMRHPNIDYTQSHLNDNLSRIQAQEDEHNKRLGQTLKRAWAMTTSAPNDRRQLRAFRTKNDGAEARS